MTLDQMNERDSKILKASRHLGQYDIDKLINNIRRNGMMPDQIPATVGTDGDLPISKSGDIRNKPDYKVLQEDDGEID